MIAEPKVKKITVEAKIIRADGKVENLGVISAYYSNPIKRLLHLVKSKLGRGKWRM
jgi:hypothetical protein